MSSNDTHPPCKVECVIIEKVYFSCKQKECFDNVCICLPHCGCPFTFVDITFLNGVILPDTIVITPIEDQPNYARAQFTVRISYTLRVRNAEGTIIPLNGTLPDIDKDIVIYFPQTPNEFDLNLRVETRSELLAPPIIGHGEICIAVGTFLVFKVTGMVQLSIPALGFCPPPDDCVEFPDILQNPCVKFFDENQTPFPDFYPIQLDKDD